MIALPAKVSDSIEQFFIPSGAVQYQKTSPKELLSDPLFLETQPR
jgi:hypothetical protein